MVRRWPQLAILGHVPDEGGGALPTQCGCEDRIQRIGHQTGAGFGKMKAVVGRATSAQDRAKVSLGDQVDVVFLGQPALRSAIPRIKWDEGELHHDQYATGPLQRR